VTADFLNAQKRNEREARTRADYAIQDFAAALLPVLDALCRAAAAAEESARKEDAPAVSAMAQGIEAIRKQLDTVLTDQGVQPIKAEGEKFDPDYHEAVSVAETEDHPDGIVLKELEKGFMLKGRVIRASRVVVSRRPPAPAEVPDDTAETQAPCRGSAPQDECPKAADP